MGVIDAIVPDAGTEDSTTMGTGGVAGAGCSMIGGTGWGAGVGVAVDAGAEDSTTVGTNGVARPSGSDPSRAPRGGGGGGAGVGVMGERGAEDSSRVGTEGGVWTN